MQFLNKYQSLNYNKRAKNSYIKYIIIHYTAMNSCKEAINFLLDKKNKVSSHYIVSKSGFCYNLVEDRYRAWHAGLSKWKKIKDLNSYSLGVELDYSGPLLKNESFPTKQMEVVIKLIKFLQKKYNIKNQNILGHSDISPYRKIDPGKKFPWDKLFIKKIGYLPKKNAIYKSSIRNKKFVAMSHVQKINEIIYMLSIIGYDISKAKKNKKSFKDLVMAYKMHFLSKKISGIIDFETYETIKKHVSFVLTNK